MLRSEGRSFCVGFDVGADGYDPGKVPWRYDALKLHQRLGISVRTLMTPWTLRKPVIASVQGHWLGGGCELAMFCDLTIAADNAVFGEPEILFSHLGPALPMPMIIGHKRARELLYSGDTIDAKTALAWGMVNRVVPLAELARDHEIRQAAGADRAGGAGGRQARGQSRRRGRGLPQRAAGRPRRLRAALRGDHRGRQGVRGDQEPRRPQGRARLAAAQFKEQ